MFPLHQSNELSFQICPNHHQHHTISQDLILKQHDHINVFSNSVVTTPFQLTKAKKTKTTTTPQGSFRVVTPNNESMQETNNSITSCDNNNNSNNNNMKRVLHREIERQRRKEMASLFSTLRSLLPLDSLKGKRSMSDHMYEAVKHIKHLQNKVKNLNRKRDQLKQLISFDNRPESCASVRNSTIDVEVRKWCEGVEIVIRRCFMEQELPLSMVLKLLIQEGLSIVSCFFTQVKTTELVYTIHCQPSENVKCVDPSELHDKIGKIIQAFNL